MIYRFADLELDDGRRQLRRDGRPLRVRPKVFSLLRHLLEQRGRVVACRELLCVLWPDVHVAETSLSTLVHEARCVLGDSGRRQHVIRTLPGRGYRLVAPVRLGCEAPAEGGRPRPRLAEVFVGRHDCLARFASALDGASDELPRLLIVRGELGIGRSRSLDAMARLADTRGWTVRRARAVPGGPPLRPWLDLLRAGGDAAAAELCEELARGEALAGRLTSARHRLQLFERIGRELGERTREPPGLLVLDDLQASDVHSLDLLRHLLESRGRRGAPLILAALREPRRESDDARARQLAVLSSLPAGEVIDLPGFARAELTEYLLRAGWSSVDDRRLDAIRSLTGGNPLLLRAVGEAGEPAPGRRGIAVGAAAASPLLLARLRDELASLSRPCRSLLPWLAVIGPCCERPWLAAASGLEPTQLDAALAEAIATGLVRTEARRPFGYRFRHPLLRQVLYHSLAPSMRARLHLRVAVALESGGRVESDHCARALARHFLLAAPAGGAALGVRHAARAARRSGRAGRWHEAVRLYREGLSALALVSSPDEGERARLLLALAHAERRAGRLANARTTARRARDCRRAARAHSTDSQSGRPVIGSGLCRPGGRRTARRPTVTAYANDVVALYLRELIDWESYFAWRKGEGFDLAAERAALSEVIETAAQICSGVEASTRAGWEQTARLENGRVIYPPHIRAAYEQLCAAGLISFGVQEQYGGFELPTFVANVILEMVARADAGLMTMVGLQAGVAEDIQIYANEDLKRRYLPGFASGELMGAMDLTEPQAGSDLGAILTRAREKDGRFFLEGEKIFITNGGCEVHLVLARDDEEFEASKGTTRGLSLYLVPRHLEDGSPNGVEVTRLEHKLGIHGSPTAAIRFEHAEGFRVGTRGEGFKAMLTLMNNARLGVAAQGIGIAEAAMSTALAYARDRVQFGKPIAEQPLMKDKLAGMVLSLEASRALLYRASALVDRNHAIGLALARSGQGAGGLSEAERSELEAERRRGDIRIRLLTPLAKYMGTEAADQITRDAIQIHGGLGFMAESEVGKLHNDAIITTIYEGTSEIQVSFVLKEIGKGALAVVFASLKEELDAIDDPELRPFADAVQHGMSLILDASTALLTDFEYALMSAQSLAEVMASVIAGAELLKQARADRRRLDLAASWINRRMVDLEARCQRIKKGSHDRLDRCDRIIALVR